MSDIKDKDNFLVTRNYMIENNSDYKINGKNIYTKTKELEIPFFSLGRSKFFYKYWKELSVIRKLLKKCFIISFGNHKGGVGKTTTVLNIASILAFFKFKVLILDMDTQATLTKHFIKDAERENSILNAINGKKVTPIIIQEEYFDDRLQLITNDLKLSKEYCLFKEAKLQKFIDSVKDKYDFIFLDLPPNYSDITGQSMGVSNHGVAILESDMYSADGLMGFLDVMEEKKLNLLMGIITGVNPKVYATNKALGYIKTTFNRFNINLDNTLISETTIFKEIALLGRGGRYSILLNSPKHKLTTQYIKTTLELLNQLVKKG